MGSSVPGSSSNCCRCCTPRANTGCFVTLAGTCVYYSATSLSGPGINRNDSLNTVVEKLTTYIEESSGGGSGTVTSVGLTMPAAFSVAGSPVTSSGTLAVTGAGITAQYIRGDGSLATFPTLASGIYEPSTTIFQGISSIVASTQCPYMRVGNTVTFTARFAIAPSGAGEEQFEFTLPIASNLGVGDDLIGVVTGTDSVNSFTGRGYLNGDTGNGQGFVSFTPSVALPYLLYVAATYTVI